MSGSEEEENMDASMMNNHDDDDDEPQDPNRPPTLDPPDADTIRIIVSTDNHLGYNERDAVRGLDSFAALEEVLFLAKELQADMVLLAGDLFHDNKPSRRTLHKTMQLFRTYCMGPNPVQIQILNNNDNSNDTSASSGSVFRQGHVNYEDEHYSVDLPIFAIHGNHDDPTREGGTGNELLAALDLLDAANLVNYIGRQEQVNQISIEPVLIKKGISHLALYGMGSMRDERLNRMWQSQKVQFARPEVNDNDQEQPQAWFNLFALHQNRDLGRGTKNCVHESMIPEWMDLVVWGHEHECCIEPQESVVGTFRITQPGSSVATSLSVGESSIKKIGVLDIRGSHFRLLPIPLTQVRSFVLGEFRLTDQSSLDPEDPKVEPKITSLLEDQVRLLVYNAREKTKEIWQAAKDAGNLVARANTMPLSMALEKPAEVLVRIKVDHSGFSTLNNQRFGAKFIGRVANPSDILLFHRKKSAADPSKSNKNSVLAGMPPMAPEELEEMNIEDLICDQLDQSDKKLELYDQKRMGGAVESYVQKQQARAITDALSTLLQKQQKVLLNNKSGRAKAKDEDDDDDDDDEQEMKDEDDETPANKRNRATSRRQQDQDQDDEQDDLEARENGFTDSKRGRAATSTATKTKRTTRKPAAASSRKPIASSSMEEEEEESDDMMEASPPPKAKSRAAKPSTVSRKQQRQVDSSDDDDEVEAVPPPKASRARAATTKRATTTKSRVNYKQADNDSDGHQEDVIDIDDDSDSDDAPPPPKKTRARAPVAAIKTKRKATTTTTSKAASSSQQSSSRGRGMSQSQISFAPTPKSSRKAATRKIKYTASSDEEDAVTPKNRSYEELEDDWGTANTNTNKS